MSGKSDYESLLLAAVVHDIGKFWQGMGEGGKHQELGAKFVRMHFPEQWQEAAGLIAMHHEVGRLAPKVHELLKIQITSDWLTPREWEGREETCRWIEPLISIFSEIRIRKNWISLQVLKKGA